MEFWGAEIKSGDSLEVAPGEDRVLHLSQACIGEAKKGKGNESVSLYVTVDGNRLVLGTLFSEKLPQQQFDLVFDRRFELSHNWKNGSVYFYGYKADNPYDEVPSSDSEPESDEDIPLVTANTVNPEAKTESEKPAEAVKAVEPKTKSEKPAEVVKAVASKGKESAGKQKVKIVEPPKEVESSDDMMSEDEEDDDDDEDDSEDVDEDDSDDESAESEEETPKKAEPSKKRAAESATKTPVQDKKAKVTPQKTDGKKVSGHVATPYPAKAGKTPANASNQKTPQSGASVVCKSCSKTFGTDKALESHSKAKHTAVKK